MAQHQHQHTIFAGVHAPDPQWLGLAEQEPALEPELPIVDTHLHLWDHAGYRYFLEEHVSDLAACGHRIEASVYVECFEAYRADGPEHLKWVGETEFAVGMGAMAASGKYTPCHVAQGIVGFCDLRLGERTEEALDAHIEAANGRFRGIRQRAKWDPDPRVRGNYCADGPGLYLDPDFGKGIDALGERGLSFDASVFHPQIPEVAALARSHPEVNIVLNHSGSPVGHSTYAGKEKENHAIWLAGMRELARCPNAYVKLGGVLMNLANFDFTRADRPPTARQLADLWRPYIEPCIELFGAERCMVSSNFPVDKVAFSFRTVWNMFKTITRSCSRDEKSQLYSRTARRVYRLPSDTATHS
ncbi:amidohydrolase [Hydrogenophaga sp.]|uniref:amidohydrolase family protein n=1 Tax=Hydrogenophaga sp. TaxID=1904254 RepID=UPI0027160786|nr:amidohydrolase family protein [Hydrogenophaga sp.]MDO9435860.1 amidohydrolase family protein [Hydrogenophaga sp.]